MRLSNRAIRANILKYLRAEPEPHTRKRGKCAGCDHFKEHLDSVDPPLCDHCTKVHRGVESVLPQNKAATRAKRTCVQRMKRKGLDAGGVMHATRMTRARGMAMNAMVGVVAFFCAASMFGSQFQGPLWHHVLGLEVKPEYEPTFSINSNGAHFECCDILELATVAFLALLERYRPERMFNFLFIITMDCSLASRANMKATPAQKRAYYRRAIAKMESFVTAARRTFGVYVLWEFVKDEYVLNEVEETFPDISRHDVAEHLYEKRPRAFMADFDSDGPDDQMAGFKEELELAIERGGGTHCAADAFELHGITVPERAKMFGTLSSRQSRKTDKGMDPWVKPCPTICCKEEAIVLVLPCGREIVIPPEVLHWIRTQGGDFPFEFSPTDDDKLRHRILGMGVSTIVGAALRRALERWIEEHGLLLVRNS